MKKKKELIQFECDGERCTRSENRTIRKSIATNDLFAAVILLISGRKAKGKTGTQLSDELWKAVYKQIK